MPANTTRQRNTVVFLVIALATGLFYRRRYHHLPLPTLHGTSTTGLLDRGSATTDHVPMNNDHREKERDRTYRTNHDEIADRRLYLLDLTDASSALIYETTFGQLNWNASTTYQDLLRNCKTRHGAANGVPLSSLLEGTTKNDAASRSKQTVVVNHQVPKTGSTSVRNAVIHRNHDACPSFHGFLTKCDEIPSFLEACPSLRFFFHWSFSMDSSKDHPCFDYHQTHPAIAKKYTFLRTIPFRNFNEWAHSAMKQIAKKHSLARHPDEQPDPCELLQDKFSRCDEKGYMELDFQKYSQRILQTVLNESPSDEWVFLYDFKNTSFLMQDFLEQVGQEPFAMDKRKNNKHLNASCPSTVLSMFHACFDAKLITEETP